MLVLQDHASITQMDAAEQQELLLVGTQPGLQSAGDMINFLTAELDDCKRERSEQYCNLMRQLEYMTRVSTAVTAVTLRFAWNTPTVALRQSCKTLML